MDSCLWMINMIKGMNREQTNWFNFHYRCQYFIKLHIGLFMCTGCWRYPHPLLFYYFVWLSCIIMAKASHVTNNLRWWRKTSAYSLPQLLTVTVVCSNIAATWKSIRAIYFGKIVPCHDGLQPLFSTKGQYRSVRFSKRRCTCRRYTCTCPHAESTSFCSWI